MTVLTTVLDRFQRATSCAARREASTAILALPPSERRPIAAWVGALWALATDPTVGPVHGPTVEGLLGRTADQARIGRALATHAPGLRPQHPAWLINAAGCALARHAPIAARARADDLRLGRCPEWTATPSHETLLLSTLLSALAPELQRHMAVPLLAPSRLRCWPGAMALPHLVRLAALVDDDAIRPRLLQAVLLDMDAAASNAFLPMLRAHPTEARLLIRAWRHPGDEDLLFMLETAVALGIPCLTHTDLAEYAESANADLRRFVVSHAHRLPLSERPAAHGRRPAR